MQYRVLGNPVVAAGAAAAIVFAGISFAASKLPDSQSSGERQSVEYATLAKRMMVVPPAPPPMAQPELKVNVGQPEKAAIFAQATTSHTALNAPQIARTGKVSLYVGNVDAAVSLLTQLAQRAAGDVFSEDLSHENGDQGASAQMDLRIPANRFDEAMNGVAKIGKVRERSIGAEDLTSDITDSDARLRNLRQTEADIRVIMNRSGSVSQVMDAENQLSEVREQIETLESEIASMRDRVSYATIDLDVETEIVPAPVEPGLGAQVTSAWTSALHSLAQFTVGLVAFGLWLLVFMPYMALAVLTAWAAYAQVRKRSARASQL